MTRVCAIWTSNGVAGGAYVFDGINDKITVADDDTLTPDTEKLTVSVWVYFDSAT